ncbi:MAG: UDP-2,3-diacylglucosamine diphosphatase LpxI, partial [Proteobacteria bacterium]|nr:UDP-2,3-diacylglucosamine diphosphatase LpxI [Pseudomonadota bacterium]
MPPKLGILAGGGPLPGQIIQACRDGGRDFFVIAFKDQADAGAFDGVPHAWVRLGAAGESLGHLRGAGCKELVLAGTIRRPSFSALRPDTWTALFFAKSGADILGDDGLLSAIVRTLEENEGFHVIGADALLPDLLATEGVYGGIEPDSQAWEDIECGIEAARKVGSHDIAQSAVAQLGQVLAVEDKKGTDALLQKVRKLRLNGPGGVLVKVKKPGQEHRVDLPAIGLATVEAASRAGLRGIAVEAGGALVFDREAL